MIANGRRNENVNMQVKINRCATNEDTAKVIQEFEEIAKNKKSNIVWLAYCQGQIFHKFREKERFVRNMVLKFQVCFKEINRRLPKNKRLVAVSSLFKKNEIDKRNMQRKH